MVHAMMIIEHFNSYVLLCLALKMKVRLRELTLF